MLVRIYCIYDLVGERIVGDILPLFPSDGAACRMFLDGMRGKTVMADHPKDYALLCLGSVEADASGEPFVVGIKNALRSPLMLGKDAVPDPAQLAIPFTPES